MQEPEFELDIDDRLNATLVITCPQCGRKHKRRFQDLRAGSTVECGCGFTLVMSDDNFRSCQRQLDELRRTLK